MKIQPLVIATTLAVLFTGCAGTSPTRLLGNTIGVAGGALLGGTLGKQNPLATAAGAGAGLLLSESLQAGSTAAANKSYAAGYEKGRSDSAKQQYHTLIEQQRKARLICQHERSPKARRPTSTSVGMAAPTCWS
jgi:hypothetical protein